MNTRKEFSQWIDRDEELLHSELEMASEQAIPTNLFTRI